MTPDGFTDVRNVSGIVSGKVHYQIENATWAAVLRIGYNPFYREWQILECKTLRWRISRKDAEEMAWAVVQRWEAGDLQLPRAGAGITYGDAFKVIETPDRPWAVLSAAKAFRYKNGKFEEEEADN